MQKEVVLGSIAKRLRYHVLNMTTKAGSGHPSTCMSMAELMSCLFFDEMRFNVKDPNDLSNDEFVLSKGHASPILWATFAEAGVIPIKQLDAYRKFGSVLEGHPTPRMPWIKAATGSLGQGLSVGLGLALAARLQKSSSRVFVMMGDGECAEGNVWEAAALASKWELSNVVAILDANRLGQSGESLHGWDVVAWKRKFEAFGWSATIIDGHDVHQILDAFSWARSQRLPSVIIAKTMKGRGFSFIENKEGWHGKTLKPDELVKALAELGPLPKVDAKKLVKKPAESSSFNLRPTSFNPSSFTLPPSTYELGDLVATREAYGVALQKLGGDSRIVALDADVKNSTFSEKFKARYAERFVDCFIAEQNMAAVAVGLAGRGFVPFVSTFAAFLSRAHDQVRMAGVSQANVKFCGSHVGISIGEDGPSQMGLEDLGLFRAVPNSVVLYPSDAVSAEKCAALLAHTKGVGYLRTSRPKTPVIYNNKESFKVGGCKVLRRGKKVVIAAGVALHEALKAADVLGKNSVTVIDAYSVKPLDARTILKESRGKKVVVVEDHYAEGGLGEAVAALGVPIVHLCVRGVPRSGKPEVLLAKHGIDANSIVRAVRHA
ncbi:transketolase [Candidatus Woesearchaeota archaeon]|nr:transketolase [Candidatus Woesearchaeota archaeon]